MRQPVNYDVIVIGTSQGGRFLPIAFAKAGRKVALIERGHLGGVCVNFGCTPTKTMVASARVAYLAKRGAEYGVHTGPVSVDLQAVRKRKQGMVEGARNNFESGLKPLEGLDLLRGEARFIGSKTLEVSLADGETRAMTAPLIFIDTGARPKQLTIEGVDSVPPAQFNHDHGTGLAARTPVDHWWRLHRAGVWSDVSPLWQPGHDHSASSTLVDERGSRCLWRNNEDLTRGWDHGLDWNHAATGSVA
jgi:hypothetical protein